MAAHSDISARTVAELVVQLGCLTRGEGSVTNLTFAQWTALRYFSSANRISRTVSAFAEFHGTTRGTASQTIKSLVQNGYLTRKRSKSDGRSIDLTLTGKSKKLLVEDPFELLVDAASSLSNSVPYCRIQFGAHVAQDGATARQASFWKVPELQIFPRRRLLCQ